jgi:hypothetical protein
VAQVELHDESSDCGAGEAFDTLLIDLDGDGALDLAVRQHKWDSHGCEDWDGGNEDETTFAVKLWKGREFVLSDSFPKEKIESLFKSAGHAMLPDLPRDQHTLQCGTAAQKSRQPTVPVAPNSDRRAAGDDVELPEATVFHLMLRSSEHAGSLLNWYAPEMEKRGAKRVGDMYVDDNLVHSGGFGRDGTAAPKDPTKPGIWMQVFESDRETLVDIWESVPKAR